MEDRIVNISHCGYAFPATDRELRSIVDKVRETFITNRDAFEEDFERSDDMVKNLHNLIYARVMDEKECVNLIYIYYAMRYVKTGEKIPVTG